LDVISRRASNGIQRAFYVAGTSRKRVGHAARALGPPVVMR